MTMYYPTPSDKNGLTSLRDARLEWWANWKPSEPYQPPTEPVTPTWVLLGKEKPTFAEEPKPKKKRKVKRCRDT